MFYLLCQKHGNLAESANHKCFFEVNVRVMVSVGKSKAILIQISSNDWQ